ncbi:hypothetical protein Dtox_3412 [Desulfofarcimen acetoxidans DSM 771]|uniref:Uncharacterized protein n=1 Tax=Desulfofarcimen acetoxidans (strain ATCC 49208 / DSM 771 / KCTC 5769 / VKM B-1644 / 5575) TaxID=485916 RepID=C8W6M7_DESAS|nr:hypothetical protein Dtox_3412 [Desulfofarcimen acetoxidans DSM 771]
MVVINITYAPLFYRSKFLTCGRWVIKKGLENAIPKVKDKNIKKTFNLII